MAFHGTLRGQPRIDLPIRWWLKQFGKAGLTEVQRHNFATRDYVRGHGMGLTDWDPAEGEGFHLVLRRGG